ncbi:hypothetical protein EXIGLDRAFT_719425 [Exidia glandulosa HHB12029]|uniref:Cation efflux protein n=1 Tax=Exidia glandulosa HHB12029 TaxID=1314781 RepID=A0A165H2L2_EXIGL|nr:hypothetical protein EXIGLDRAFT_719425 [Exidia glandulosa HHB12029]
MHRRRTSSEADAPELTTAHSQDQSAPVAFPDGKRTHTPAHPYAFPPPPPSNQRQRVHSTPAPYDVRHPQLPVQQLDTSLSPYSGLAPPRSASVVAAAPYRATSFPAASPSSPSFRNPFNGPQLGPSVLAASAPLPESDLRSPSFAQQPPPPANAGGRRHGRIHSRNLSVFFPRPGQTAPASIAEDGAQEIEVSPQTDAPITIIPPTARAAGSPRTGSPQTNVFAPGFKFGGRATASPGDQLGSPRLSSPTTGLSPSTTTARRGHHHKHSLSHNFFSFLDPTVTNPTPQIRTSLGDASPSLPVPSTPLSPWQPMSPFPLGNASPSVRTRVDSAPAPAAPLLLDASPPIPGHSLVGSMPFITLYAVLEFLTGASLWVIGQQNGSLSCTGFGYWVVFDAMGIMLGAGADAGVFRWLLGQSATSELRRPYGHERMETTGLFAQTIYLLFAAVYICKETVEHFLLSFGESHHHHAFDEYSVDTTPFSTALVAGCLLFIIASSRLYSNHLRLVHATGRTIPIPSLDSIQRLFLRVSPASSKVVTDYSRRMTNPFFAAPLAFATLIVFSSLFVPADRHRALDLLLAGIETFVTFRVAYPAAVALGKVLLQTAPDRGTVDGRMESFLRVMRELERHPQVVHLPPPHIWQLTPPSKVGSANSLAQSSHLTSLGQAQLVAALELHVRKDLSDSDALALTRWAWERCYSALNPRGSPAGAWGDHTGGGITVGIARDS